MRTLRSLKRSVAPITTVYRRTPASRARSNPRRFGINAETSRWGSASAARATASASENCGTALGETKEVTSIARIPAP